MQDDFFDRYRRLRRSRVAQHVHASVLWRVDHLDTLSSQGDSIFRQSANRTLYPIYRLVSAKQLLWILRMCDDGVLLIVFSSLPYL